MKNFNTLLGFALCLSFVSFAPKALITEGRAPASGDQPSSITVRVTQEKKQLFVFGPLIIHQRSERIQELRIEYRRLQSDVQRIARQKAEIERLISANGMADSEITRLKTELAELAVAHDQTKAELDQLKGEFETQSAEMKAEIDALTAANEVSESEKQQALALLEAERSLAQSLSTDVDNLKVELEQTRTELAEAKTQLEEAQAQIVAKEEELLRVKCENEDALASLKEDIKKIEEERNELDSMILSMQEDYEAQIAAQKYQNQMIMMAMAQFSFQAMMSPTHNPYLRESSLFDPTYQMMHQQQAQLLDVIYKMKAPGITNNYYGDYSMVYGSGLDVLNGQGPGLGQEYYSLFANQSAMNSNRMPSSIQPSLAPGYFAF